MLLINGKVMDNTATRDAIQQMDRMLPCTLIRNDLTQEMIINAIDQLITQFKVGNMFMELQSFSISFDLNDLNEQLNLLTKENLKKRIEIECGNDVEVTSNCKILTLPLGVVFHIAAGNLDVLPVYSVLESLLMGNINILKLPSLDQGLTIFILEKLINIEPQIKDYIYVFDTPSSDLLTIQQLMNYANGIVVWGSDAAIDSVRKYAPVNCKIIEWGHKLSFAYIQDTQVSDEELLLLAKHMLDTKQLLCSSCQGIFIDTTDFESIKNFGKRFNQLFNKLNIDSQENSFLQGKVTIELLTKKLEKTDNLILENKYGSVICSEDMNLELSLLNGNCWIKPLPSNKISQQLSKYHSYLQTVGVYPMETHLIELFSRVGCTSITSISKMSNFSFIEAHDGRFPLNEYCRRVNIKS